MSPARPATRLITFTSDYGPADEFVGVCHAVIAAIAPRVRVIDFAHGVRGIRAGAAALAQSAPYAPAGAVHLAVVDPGVGTDRKCVALATGSGARLVGPDNGLLIDAADALGGCTAAYELRTGKYRLQPVSATFHGRDVFAPAAAHLALGVEPSALGPEIDRATLVRLREARVRAARGRLEADVLRADWFGNLQLAATVIELEAAALGKRSRVRAGRRSFEAVVGTSYADAPAGELVVLIDSGGHVCIAANGESAAERLGRPGAVRLSRLD